MVFVLRSSLNHTSIKYMCPLKKVLNDIHMPYMPKLGVKHGNKKDTCYIKIVGPCAQKLGTNLVSIVYTNLGWPI